MDGPARRAARPRNGPRRVVGGLIVGLLACSTLALALVTTRVGLVLGTTSHPEDVTKQLAFLRGALDDGAGHDMQALFPEGYFFTHALTGLAWTDLAATGHADRQAAITNARWALERLDEPDGTAPFDRDLDPPYGVFHAGWSLLLRAQLAALDPTATDAADATIAQADGLAAAVERQLGSAESPFLTAYPGQSWPVDSVVAVAALRTADRATGGDHHELIERWRARAGRHLDPRTGLLPHRTEPGTAAILDGTRGTSQAIIQRLWPLIDPDGAPGAYERFRRQFVTTEAGLVGVREYPHGLDGPGDVDSGPLVLGVSASATAVMIGAARANGDPGLTEALRDEADVFGVPLDWRGERRYALGVVPVADAFVAWASATPPGSPQAVDPVRPWWPTGLALAWLALGGAWFPVVRRRRVRHRSPDGPALA